MIAEQDKGMEGSAIKHFEKLSSRCQRRQESRTKKQLKERCRRERIGNALEDLKTLIYQRDKKVDKVEVLESTVSFLRERRRKDDESAYLSGYNACLVEFTSFLMQADYIDYQAKVALLNNISELSSQVQQRQQERLRSGEGAGRNTTKNSYFPRVDDLRDHFAESADQEEEPSSTQIVSTENGAQQQQMMRSLQQIGVYRDQSSTTQSHLPERHSQILDVSADGKLQQYIQPESKSPLYSGQFSRSSIDRNTHTPAFATYETSSGQHEVTSSSDTISCPQASNVSCEYQQRVPVLKYTSVEATFVPNRAPLSRIENKTGVSSAYKPQNIYPASTLTGVQTMASQMGSGMFETPSSSSRMGFDGSAVQSYGSFSSSDNIPHSTSNNEDFDISGVDFMRYATVQNLALHDDLNLPPLSVFLQRMYASRDPA